MSRLLFKQDDWWIILIFWSLSFEVGWQIPLLGVLAAGMCGLMSLIESGTKAWAWLISEDPSEAFGYATSVIVAFLFSLWLVPGFTVGYWLPLLGHLFQQLSLC